MANLDDIEQVRMLVKEEGKSARNILAFSVPHEAGTSTDNGQKMPLRKPPLNSKPLLIRLEDKVPKLVTVLKTSRARIRSASAGRDRKSDLQARYWGLLFENLRRAVDEIYLTCESDESVEECKEAIMILEACTKDFRNLIEWLKLKWNYEKTPAPQRPTSLAWEVRKSSPAKPSCTSIMGQLQKAPAGLARRMLSFDEDASIAAAASEPKPPITAEFPIKTINEVNETVVAKAAPQSAPPARKAVTKSPPEAIRNVKTADTTKIISVKPKAAWKVGKASKNAVNSEVQSQSLAHRITKTVSATPSHKIPAIKSWAQRVAPKSEVSQPQTRPKLTKPELPKFPVRQPIRPQSTVVPVHADQEDGWETVRGRTRSRTSPIKAAPLLIRASTVVYTSRHEAKQSAAKTAARQLQRQPTAAQSLPSLCDHVADKPVEQKVELETPVIVDEIVVSTDDDEAEEAAEVAEEEAEMARREEALTMEEESLQREIRETERSDTEGEESWEDPLTVTPVSTPEGEIDDPPERSPVQRDVLEEKYHLLLENCSWADQMELLDQLEEFAAMDGARQPGRALQVHEKLSSPSRRRLAEPCEAFQQHEAKQLRAQQHRVALREEKTRKRRELTKRMDEIREAKGILLDEKKQLLERRMKRAEEKRLKHLAEIVKKAHDEEEKKKEIAFINSIEAQNKRHDFIAHIQTQEERIQGLQEERQRRQEERKLAKEAAVEERKRVLEAERQAKMALLQEKRRQREERIDREHQEKEKERLEIAREKERDRQERLSALQAAHQASQSQLQRKIQQKQEESARRHEENMEQIRQKALELSILRFSSAGSGDDTPGLVNYDTARVCSLCDVQIDSEATLMNHLRGKKHMEALKNHYGGKEPSREQSESSNLKFIVEAITNSRSTSSEKSSNAAPESEKEKRAKTLKKRAKKMKSKVMQQNATESSLAGQDGAAKHRISRIIQDLERDPSGHDRHWAELVRLLEKGSAAEQLIFGGQRGVHVVAGLLGTYLSEQGSSASRFLLASVNCLRLATRSNLAMSTYLVNSRAAPLLLALLSQRLEILDSCQVQDVIATAVMNAWSVAVEAVTSGRESVQSNPDLMSRCMTLVSYAVSLGIVDRLALHIGGVRGPFESPPDLLVAALKFVTSLIELLHLCQKPPPTKKTNKSPSAWDTTQLMEAMQVTELVGVVNALYGLLLHQGVADGELPADTLRFTVSALQLMHRLALLDLNTFQGILGAEGVSLEFRHIASFLLCYGVNATSNSGHLLNLTVLCIGYFATGHHENQMILQSGHMPSVLQQLCRLPFGYFSDKAQRAVLLPTLLACCHDNAANLAVLQKEMSYQMVEDYVNSDDGRSVQLVRAVLRIAPNA